MPSLSGVVNPAIAPLFPLNLETAVNAHCKAGRSQSHQYYRIKFKKQRKSP
jgi:hypothetical protein